MQVRTADSYSALFSGLSPAELAEQLRKTRNGGVIQYGTGHMGARIAAATERAGLPVYPQDRNKEIVDASIGPLSRLSDKAVRARALGPYQRAHAVVTNLIQPPVIFPNGNKLPDLIGTPDEKKEIALRFLEEVLDPDIRRKYQSSMLVLEALPEKLEVKQKVFEFLSYVLPEDAILATNTSSLSIDEIARNVLHPERVLGIHYFDPADQDEAAEVILGPKTDRKFAAVAYSLLKAEGKKPIIVFKDKPLAVGNRIFVAVLRKAAELVERGLASKDQVDQIYLETFYEEQIGIKFTKVKEKFKEAIKLDFFDDEAGAYRKVEKIDQTVAALTLKGKYSERDKFLDEKVKLLKDARDKLVQKMLYANILENASVLGSAFATPKIVKFIKENAQERLAIINYYLNEVDKAPQVKIKTVQDITGKELKPYVIPDTPKKRLTPEVKKQIQDELRGIYIAAAQQIVKEGLATIPDIELICTEAFKYNIGPFSLAEQLGQREVQRLTSLVNEGLPVDSETGISAPGECIEVTEKDLSGVQTYIQGDTATIEIGWNQIQFLQNTSNSLTPRMLVAIRDAVKECEANPSIKTIFIESKGGKVFGSGASLKYVDENRNKIDKVVDYVTFGYGVIAKEIENCSKSVIAIVSGPVVGGSLETILACDAIYADETASACFLERKLKLLPLWGGTENSAKRLGKELATALACSSEWITADMACRAGLYDNSKPFLRSELYQFKLDLIAGTVPEIDIRSLKRREPEFDKRVRDYDIRKQFGLGRLDEKPHYVHKGADLRTRDMIRLIQQLINHADNPTYRERRISSEKLREIVRGALDYTEQTVKPQLWIATNKFAARTVEVLTGTMIKFLKFKKALFG